MKKLPLIMSGILMTVSSFVPDYLNCQSKETKTFRGLVLPLRADPLLIHGNKQEFVMVPSGSFLMGSNDRPDEKPLHNVMVDSFELAVTEVTVRQFRAFVQATGYKTDAESSGHSVACCWRPKIGISWRNPGFLQDDNEPVVAISWNDAVEYCRWLSSETDETYRLPSEAEWEYAASRGVNPVEPLDSMAWYNKNSSGKTHPVGAKNCNMLGLYDMIGNSWEWTSDIYHDSYIGAPSDGISWNSGRSSAQNDYLKTEERRVLRGGSWGLSEKMHPVSYDLRITSRPVFGKDNSCNNSGFRLARDIEKDFVKGGEKLPEGLIFSALGIDYDIVWLANGHFIMGNESTGPDMKPLHSVIFTKPFGIGRTEVTVEQFRSFTEETGYMTEAEITGECWDSDFRTQKICSKQKGLNWENPGFIQSGKDPVTCITWNDAMAFCKWLSIKTGLMVRLPSEAEWEYAMCGLQDSDASVNYKESAWFYDNSEFRTHPVGQLKSNINGIYDMLGNVSEWTMDIWCPDYSDAPEDGSSLLGPPVEARVIRGGSFERESSEMGPRMRDWYGESEAVVGTGFRIVVL
jgi:formylglycine-generating enzyme required for sulfatase activity